MDDRFSRQSFLGANAQDRISTCVVGIVGLGGGGSHIAQQLAHIGFQRYVIFDNDIVEDSNLNRLVSATVVDERSGSPKLLVACRTIFGLQPQAEVMGVPSRWQDRAEALRRCHIVFGCVDSYAGRQELEFACRRYLIDYIDVGMDVLGADPPQISGQVILSTPGAPCMRCLGFLTDENLGAEAALYGNTGGHPQVVWPNGVLASTAVGIAVDLITNWTGKRKAFEYLQYDGNKGTIKPSVTLPKEGAITCMHHPLTEMGDTVFIPL